MKKYIESVETLFRLKSDALIPNKDKEHAVVLISNIFKHATDHVYVYCNNATQDVFGNENLQNCIQNALEKGVSVKFLTEDEVEPSYLKDLINCKKILWKQNTFHEITTQHFVEADGMSFRIEENHETAQAIGCANDKKLGAILHELFEAKWDMAS